MKTKQNFVFSDKVVEPKQTEKKTAVLKGAKTKYADGVTHRSDGSFVGQWVSPELVNSASNLNTSLFGGIASIVSAANNKSNTTTTNTNTSITENKKHNTFKWVAIAGGGVAVIVVALVLIFRKKD